MVMETAPAAALEMIEAQFLFEFLIIALNAPAQLGEAHEVGEGCCHWQRRQPILGGVGRGARPLDEEPLFGPGCRAPLVAVGRSHPEPGEARALGPSDRKSTRLNSSHLGISYAVFCLKKKNNVEESINVPNKKKVRIMRLKRVGNYAASNVFDEDNNTGLRAWSSQSDLGEHQERLWKQ